MLTPEAKKILLRLVDKRVADKENSANLANVRPMNNLEVSLNLKMDKENIQRKANISPFTKRKITQNKGLEVQPSTTLEAMKKRDELKDLKSNLWMQLAEIKNIEKKEHIIRKTNEKLKMNNSENKRQYRESLSKGKSSSVTLLHKGVDKDGQIKLQSQSIA